MAEMIRPWVLAFAFIATLVTTAQAQLATLLADSVIITAEDTITASGNVEILVDGAHLKATSIIYDAKTDQLTILGPITLQQGDEVLFLASSADLAGDLKDGILRGARLVLGRRLQLAASRIDLVDGRYTQLSNTIASSCNICADNPVPLWQIRARKITHDQEQQQLFFENAQLRIADVPVFFIPRLRLPDPTQDRATGFLVPKIISSSRIGTGIKIPYFIAIGEHADVTFTPFLTSRSTTVEARYRQAFRTGRVQIDAAVTQDELLPNTTRAYLFGTGEFDLPRDFKLSFNFELTSDPAYLLEYGFSGKDRLTSEIAINRTRENDYFNAGLLSFETLRGSELSINDQLPNLQAEVLYERRFFPQRLGGQGAWSLGLEGHQRESSIDGIGRDVGHASGRLNWSRSEIFGNGFVGRLGAEIAGDIYLIRQDSTFSPTLAFVTPAIEAELSWPLVKSTPDGAAHVLEPVLHLAWTNNLGTNVPNEDSTLVEFDEGNLLSISRFPGEDRFETGARATVGLKWTRYDPSGWSAQLAMGRVVRDGDTAQFTAASGLDGQLSDWLLAGQLKLDPRLSVTARALISDDLTVTKTETRVDWHNDRTAIAATYSRVVSDLAENRPDLTSQLTIDASQNIRRHWTGNLNFLFDFSANKSTRAEIGLKYENECIGVDFSLSRRFTSSTSVTPTTDIGFTVNLLGFGTGNSGPQRTCSG